MDGEIEPAPAEFIAQQWEEQWGLPLVSVEREYIPQDVEGFVWRAHDGRRLGLVTWFVDGPRAEIVSLHALVRNRGIGARLLGAAEEELRLRSVKTARVVTTNDNLHALSFYLRRGYRLVRLHLGAMDRVRRVKPDVPLVGSDGIPLRDMWWLEIDLQKDA